MWMQIHHRFHICDYSEAEMTKTLQTTSPRIPLCCLALLSSCLSAAAGKMAADTGRYRSAVSKNKDPSGLLISVIR